MFCLSKYIGGDGLLLAFVAGDLVGRESQKKDRSRNGDVIDEHGYADNLLVRLLLHELLQRRLGNL
jgi:hypothetical protein